MRGVGRVRDGGVLARLAIGEPSRSPLTLVGPCDDDAWMGERRASAWCVVFVMTTALAVACGGPAAQAPGLPPLPTGGARIDGQLRARLAACGDRPALSCVPNALPADGEPADCEALSLGGTVVDDGGMVRRAPDAFAWTKSDGASLLDALPPLAARLVRARTEDAPTDEGLKDDVDALHTALLFTAHGALDAPNVVRLTRACFAETRTALTDALGRAEAQRFEIEAKVRATKANAWLADRVAECRATWTTSGCTATLDFLSDSDRTNCQKLCTAAATEASDAAFEAAVQACGDQPLKAPAACSLSAPPGAAVSAESQNAYCVAKCIVVRHTRERERQLAAHEAVVAKAQDAAAQRQAAADAEANRGLMCRDGTESPSCLCHGPHRGCCSWHGGVAGCSSLTP